VDPLGYAEHTLGTNGVEASSIALLIRIKVKYIKQKEASKIN